MTQSQCKLLVVGLQESESEFLAELENAEFQISLFNTGKQALEHIRNHAVDLIIVDGSLPNPTQLCQAIIGEAADIPIVLLLSSEDLVDLDSIMDAPIDRFFIKPLVNVEVLANLQALLRRMVWQKHASTLPADDTVYQPEEIYCCYHTS
jgi:two-component system, OmpR family, response regulator ResD